MAKRISRDFDVYIPNRSEPVEFKGKARSEVDGMGTRIINHDGSVAFSMSGNVSVVETNSVEEDYTPASEQTSTDDSSAE